MLARVLLADKSFAVVQVGEAVFDANAVEAAGALNAGGKGDALGAAGGDAAERLIAGRHGGREFSRRGLGWVTAVTRCAGMHVRCVEAVSAVEELAMGAADW